MFVCVGVIYGDIFIFVDSFSVSIFPIMWKSCSFLLTLFGLLKKQHKGASTVHIVAVLRQFCRFFARWENRLQNLGP